MQADIKHQEESEVKEMDESVEERTARDARRCLVNRALNKYQRKGLARFDSATYFLQNQPRKCTSDSTGNLQLLRDNQPTRNNPPSTSSTLLSTSTTSGKDNGLKVLAQLYAGGWALEQTGNSEFSESITSGLTRLATICGRFVRSQKDKRHDPWALTTALTENERHAMAALVAEVLLKEMDSIAEQQALVNDQIRQRHSTEEVIQLHDVSMSNKASILPHRPLSKRVSLLRRPPPSRRRRSHSLEKENDTRVGNVDLENCHSGGGPLSPPGNSSEDSFSSGGSFSLPPSKAFWVSLANSGIDRAKDGSFKMLKDSGRAHVVTSSNSITTA